MNDLNEINARMASMDQSEVIQIERERVLAGDPSENIPSRTVREQVTNHQITGSDRLGMYREPGWHGLGQVVNADLSGREAVREFLGWTVEQTPIWTEFNGKKIDLPMRANVRSDTGKVLGVVTDTYAPVQNEDLGDFADALLAAAKAEGVGCRMETCGSLLGGRKVFLTMRPDREIRVGNNGQDVSVPLLTLLNAHDGTMAMSASWTHVRIVCNNTFRTALGSPQGMAGFKFWHMGKVQDRVQQAKAALGIAIKGLERFQANASTLAATKLDKFELREFFAQVYDAIYGTLDDKATEKQVENRAKILQDWMDLMGDDNQLIPGIAGTAWAAFNAVTQWQDHVRSAKTKQADRRDHNRLLGDASRDKATAFRIAMAMSA